METEVKHVGLMPLKARQVGKQTTLQLWCKTINCTYLCYLQGGGYKLESQAGVVTE